MATDTRLCRLCSTLNIKTLMDDIDTRWPRKKLDWFGREIYGGLSFALEAGIRFQHHASLGELRDEVSSCELCAEIWRCFSENAGLPQEDLVKELGKGLCATPVYLVFCPAEWHSDKRPKLVALQHQETDSIRILACFDVCTEAGKFPPEGWIGDCARLLYPDSGSDECLALARRWLEGCTKKHERCRTQVEGAKLPTRVINVHGEPRLVDGDGRNEPYVALSYSWGGESARQLQHDTEVEFRQALPPESLPPTIADAITITRALGIRFIWIDALCILQDDADDFFAETSKMRQTYRSAILTINGSSQAKISDGLFQQRSRHQVKIPWPNGAMPAQYVYLREDSEAQEHRLRSSPLNTRGWCLQELLLATRTLWVGQQQMIFECIELQAEEGSTTDYLVGEDYRSKDRMQLLSRREGHWLKSAHVRALGIPPVLYPRYPTVHPRTAWETGNWRKLFRFWTYRLYTPLSLEIAGDITIYDYWRMIVSHYTQRNFTYPRDIFTALTGLADAFRRATRERFMAGHWEGDLLYSLNWRCHARGQPVQQVLDAHKSAGYLAPSWSWASIISGNIVFEPARGPFSSGLQTHWRTLSSPSILEAHVELATSDPLGAISEGYLILRAPFVLITDPTAPPAEDSTLYRLQNNFYRLLSSERKQEFFGANQSRSFEFAIKHRPHADQRFALVQTGVYASDEQGRELSTRYARDAFMHVLLLETCEDDVGSSGHAGSVSVKYAGLRKWRRVMNYSFQIAGRVAFSAEPWDSEEVRAELREVKWRDMDVCLV